jgi:protein tyrosine/serine phosphatase
MLFYYIWTGALHMTASHHKIKIILILAALALIALAIAFPTLRNNIHTVIPQQVYRSAQLSPQKLDSVIKQYHIKAVINLEGSSQETWYINEVQTTKDADVTLYSIKLPAKGLPPVQQFKQLVQILSDAPKPLLIHCKNGADRTGLASAIILILDAQASLTTANQQIAWWYGAISPDSIGRKVMPMYQNWLNKNNLAHNRTNFLTWVNQVTVMGGHKTHPPDV